MEANPRRLLEEMLVKLPEDLRYDVLGKCSAVPRKKQPWGKRALGIQLSGKVYWA